MQTIYQFSCFLLMAIKNKLFQKIFFKHSTRIKKKKQVPLLQHKILG